MSQKEKKFQPKSKNFAGRSGGGKFGSRDGGKAGGKSFGKPGRSFGGKDKKFEGNRDERRPRREGSDFKPRRPREDGEFRPRRPREDGEFRPKRDFGDRKPRRDDGDFKPRRPREDGEFRPRRPREDGEFRPKRDFGDRKPRRDDGDFKPRRPREDGEFRPKREFGDRKPRRDDGDFKPRRPREDGEFRPKRDFGDRKPRRSFDDRGPSAKRYGDKPGPRKSAPRTRDSYEQRAPIEASDDTRRKLKSERASYGAPSPAYFYGHHAVRAALQNPQRHIQRLLVTENGMEQIQEAYDAALAAGIRRPEPTFVEKEDIDRLLPRDAVHQDVMADVKPLEDVFLLDILNGLAEDSTVIVLDQVTDPHNVGAILRTAAAFGAAAVVVQKLHAPDITGTLAKTASGAVEHVPMVREVNLSRALEQLREAGFTCIGLDERGKLTMAEATPATGRVALVMGAEGDGLRRLVAENCDTLAKLPTSGPIASLNVSNAAAVALYEVIRARK
ncbi:MAG TPA: 23S rRNA (guanosine(2251)-2'-O)-methyltransferase RlmB [Alphaproteobacteria bacterium]|nr:23S rRNA (guanosine(2251)-2'-O)-methyltransferase RlmB [Alphaproteobacteria bacterium]